MATVTDDNAAGEQSGKSMCQLFIIRCTRIKKSVDCNANDQKILKKQEGENYCTFYKFSVTDEKDGKYTIYHVTGRAGAQG